MDFIADLIIPYYISEESDNKFRLNNIIEIIEILPKNVSLQLVYSGNIDLSHLMKDNIFPIKIKHLSYFVKGWFYNVGVKNSITTNIVLGESDIFFPNNHFNNIIDYKENTDYRWFFAWDKLLYLKENSIEVHKEIIPKPDRAEGGLVFFDKRFYINIGGANEFYKDLGGIDNDLIRRSEYITSNYPMMSGTIKHKWHPANYMKKDDWKYAKYRKDNINLYQKVKKNPKYYLQLLSKYSNEIGGEYPLCNNYNLN